MKRFLAMPLRVGRVLAIVAVLSSSIAIGQQVPALAADCSQSQINHYASQWVWDNSRGVWVDVIARLENHQFRSLDGSCFREYVLYIYTNDGSNMTSVYDTIRYWICGSQKPSRATSANNVNSLRDNNPAWPGAGYPSSCGAQADDYYSYAYNPHWSPQVADQLYTSF
jgi:hypothetical protein